MKKNIPVIATCCVLLLGVCVILYPVISAILAKMTQTVTISNYQRAVQNLSNQEIEAMKEDARKYNETLYKTVLSDPFSQKKELDANYVKLLNIGEVMGYIDIPKINVYLPIYHGPSEEILQKGVGHLQNTSLPIGGKSTHAVLTGHRGLPTATLFTDLDQLVQGDLFYIHILNGELVYRVDQIKVVEPEDTSDLVIQQGEDYVTLVTCTPYGINTQRLLVRGTRVENESVQRRAQPELKLVNEVAVVPAGLLVVIALPVVLLIRRKRAVRK